MPSFNLIVVIVKLCAIFQVNREAILQETSFRRTLIMSLKEVSICTAC